MSAVFLKSDCEPASELAQIEKCVEVFLAVLNPTVKVDTVYNAGDVAVHLVNQRVLGTFVQPGVRHPKTHHAHRHLRHLIRVRVVHEGAGGGAPQTHTQRFCLRESAFA